MKKAKGTRNGLLPNSLRIISSCLKTVSTNAGSVASTVRSAGASVAASIAVPAPTDEKDQVLWACFDKLELSPSFYKNVLLLGYSNGFQVLDIEEASNVHELVSKRDGPVTFLQMQPIPAKSEGSNGFRSLHPMLLVIAGDETNGFGVVQDDHLSALIKDDTIESQLGNCMYTPTTVRFFSLKSNSYVHVLRFRSAVYVVRCSPRVVAVALAAQIYCFDPSTLENKFSVLTYPIQGAPGISVGYGPMAVGSRWLAYASNNTLVSNSGRLSPQNLTPSPGVSPSTSPGSGSFVARYAMESSKQLAAGIVNLGDMGYKTLSKYYQDLLPDGSTSPVSPNSARMFGRLLSSTLPNEADNAGMVVVKDFVSKEVISQFRAHRSPISALCFDPSGTLLVTASVYGNNINVFRIIPKYVLNGSSSAHYDWTSSHVHLYKLYRGLTSAIIQDISFSCFSQWISIVSSKGTCHLYLISPFGGDANLQAHSINGGIHALIPNTPLPWWSTSSPIADQQFVLPSPTTTLSVISRIKNGTSGWLNAVSTVAASATGNAPAPSGAVATVFHNTMHGSFKEINMKANSLEHLLIYSPSGHLIQHVLLPSLSESSGSSSRSGCNSQLPIQDEELRVNAEPVQWWDVCRRLNWPERGEFMSSSTQDIGESSEVTNMSNLEDSSPTSTIFSRKSMKVPEKSCWYLSNAELKGNPQKIPIWQKSKIFFYTVNPPEDDENTDCGYTSGEMDIETLPIHEVEIRRKDLLPVFQNFHYLKFDDGDRSYSHGDFLPVSSDACQIRNSLSPGKTDKCSSLVSDEHLHTETAVNSSYPATSLSTCCHMFHSKEESGYQRDILLGHFDNENSPCSRSVSSLSQKIPGAMQISCEDFKLFDSIPSRVVSPLVQTTKLDGSHALSFGDKLGHDEVGSSNSLRGTFLDLTSSDYLTLQADNGNSHDELEDGGLHLRSHCKLSSHEAAVDVDSNCSHVVGDRAEEGEDNEDILGSIFVFSEEG